MEQKRFHFHTVRQWTAAVLLMLALGIFSGKADFDQPHLHSESGPIVPTVTVAYTASGNVSAGVMSYVWNPGPRK